MTGPLVGIGSMATRRLLAALAEACAHATGSTVRFVAVGGVEAARRVRAGEPCDLVVLAADALQALTAEGHVDSGRPIADSAVAVAVPAGSPLPDTGSESALRAAVLSAGRIGYSTGPSGTALLALFARWGLLDALRDRLVQAPPGTPVAALLASGQVDLGFQQASELLAETGIQILGPMPPGVEIVTTFSGAVARNSTRTDAARQVLDFMGTAAVDAIRRDHGMAAPSSRNLP